MTPPDGWEVARDPAEVHALLLASDARAATPDAPAPARNPDRTRQLVESGCVHLYREGGRAAGMFTLTREPAFPLDAAGYPGAAAPAYLCRLAVHPDWQGAGALLGARCLRRAAEVAEAAGADVLRSEANPDLAGARQLLDLFGFVEWGRRVSPLGLRCVYLEKVLRRG